MGLEALTFFSFRAQSAQVLSGLLLLLKNGRVAFAQRLTKMGKCHTVIHSKNIYDTLSDQIKKMETKRRQKIFTNTTFDYFVFDK